MKAESEAEEKPKKEAEEEATGRKEEAWHSDEATIHYIYHQKSHSNFTHTDQSCHITHINITHIPHINITQAY